MIHGYLKEVQIYRDQKQYSDNQGQGERKEQTGAAHRIESILS